MPQLLKSPKINWHLTDLGSLEIPGDLDLDFLMKEKAVGVFMGQAEAVEQPTGWNKHFY